MTNFGSIAAKVNSQAYKISITNGGTSGKYSFLQDARLILGHAELKEPTTEGGNLYFSGTPTNRLVGTIVFSKDLFSQANIGWDKILFSRTNGEVPEFTMVVTLTSKNGTLTTFTFSLGAKCESVDVSKAAEGATKCSVSFILINDPSVT